MVNYTKQRHRYVYWNDVDKGHVFEIGQDKAYCGIKKETLSKKAKEIEGRLSTTSRFKDNQQLCKTCQGILKEYLKEQHPGWWD